MISDYITENLMNLDYASTFMLEGVKFNNKDWIEKAGKLVADHFDYIAAKKEDMKKLALLPYEEALNFIKREDLATQNEDPILDFVIEYFDLRKDLT